jgi:hypothetical protein
MKLRDEYWLLVRDLETGKVRRMIRVGAFGGPDDLDVAALKIVKLTPAEMEAYADAFEPRGVDCRD